MAAAF